MTWIGAVQCGVVVAWLLALCLKVRAQRRSGASSFVFSPGAPVPRRVLELAMTGAMFLWFFLVILHAVAPDLGLFRPVLFRSPVLAAAGAFLAVGGLGIGVTALWTMGRSWRMGMQPNAQERLVTTGVFSVSRNPIYLHFDALAVAMVLISGSLFFVLTAALILLASHSQILREEESLAQSFGREFDDYRSRVGRYLGRWSMQRSSTPAESRG